MGRILRQGNQNDEIEISTFVTESSYDTVMWQKVQAKALFIEDMATLVSRSAANAPQSLRLATMAEAPFIYDGVIMRDLTLMPTPLIAPVSGHFRQAQTILDAMRRQASLTPPEATADERVGAMRTLVAEIAAGVEKATHAVEKLDNWIARNGGASDGARALADLPLAALRGAAVDRLSQRSKTYRILREQAQARVAEINGMIDSARRGGTGPKVDMTVVSLKPDDRRAVKVDEIVTVKPEDKRAAE